jgi:hypothetical protein
MISQKTYTNMTARELAQATKEFDAPVDFPSVKPSATELAKHRRASRSGGNAKRGRPLLGTGAARVMFTIAPDLLMRLDAFARKNHMKRSNLITASVEAYMRFAASKRRAG